MTSPSTLVATLTKTLYAILRETALAETNGWYTARLPDYSSTDCIHRGNAVHRKSAEERVLDSDEINRLVRHYTGLAHRQQAAEEWWGGALALDHFMGGLPEAIADFNDGNHDQ